MGNELKALGIRIKAARESRGLSIRDLAELAGINKSQIVRIESGQSDPHYTTLLRIARALEVSVGDFTDGVASARRQTVRKGMYKGEA